jgi:hypothetical protein
MTRVLLAFATLAALGLGLSSGPHAAPVSPLSEELGFGEL